MYQLVMTCCLSLVGVTLVGCEQEEKVLDVETPAGELEVNRSENSGQLSIEVEAQNETEKK